MPIKNILSHIRRYEADTFENNRKVLLPTLLITVLIFVLILPAGVVGASASYQLPDDYAIVRSTVDNPSFASTIASNIASVGQEQIGPMVAAGFYHTVGLETDGTVLALGGNYLGQCNVIDWTDIIQVAAGSQHTVGLKADGTVAAVGDSTGGKCDVDDWTDIIQVAAGYDQTVGVKVDGTVVAVGYSGFRQGDTNDWTDIIQVAAGYGHTVGLKSD
ncbi:MAG: hypothetical protein PVI95_01130, partial [Dehalococcoidia bacterium]